MIVRKRSMNDWVIDALYALSKLTAYDMVKLFYKFFAYALLVDAQLTYLFRLIDLLCHRQKAMVSQTESIGMAITFFLCGTSLALSLNIPSFWFLRVFFCWGSCVILENSTLHGGFIGFMKFLTIAFFRKIDRLKEYVEKLETYSLFEQFLWFMGTVFIFYQLLFYKYYASHEGFFVLGLLLSFWIFISLPRLLRCSRGLTFLWICSAIVPLICFRQIFLIDFSSIVGYTISLATLWSISGLLADKACCSIVLSFFNFLTTVSTIALNIFLLVFIPYLENIDYIFPTEISFDVSAVSPILTLELNLILVPMLIGVNVAGFLKELQTYIKHITQQDSSQT